MCRWEDECAREVSANRRQSPRTVSISVWGRSVPGTTDMSDAGTRQQNHVTQSTLHSVITSCARGDTLCSRPSPPRGRPRASRPAEQMHCSNSFRHPIRSHGHCCTCFKAVASKAAWWAWPLTFWPWKWCPSHVWRGLPMCQF